MDNLEQLIALYLKEKSVISEMISLDMIALLAQEIIACWGRQGHVFIFANGGSAAAAEHFAADLSTHPFVSEDKSQSSNATRLKVLCLSSSTPVITGISNDLGFENIFREQLRTYRDVIMDSVVIAFSSSGNSKNVVEALKYARKLGAVTVCVSGNNNQAKAKDFSNVWINIPGSSEFPGQTGGNNNCFHLEDFFMSIGHMVTGLLKGVVEEQNE